jgi:hypothetical protein
MATTTYGIYSGNRREVQIGRASNSRISGGGKPVQQIRTSGPVLPTKGQK